MSDSIEAMEERVIELESRLAQFEEMADELSTVVAEQGRIIDRLATRLQAATDRMEEMAEILPQPPEDKPPPHY